MKTYIEHTDTIYNPTIGWIPKDPSNRQYQEFLEEQKNGETELLPYAPPQITWNQIRLQRERLLAASDWVALKDTNVQNEQAWLDYRQALRDIPQNFVNAEDVVWPTAP